MRTLLEHQYGVLADWLDEVPVSAHLVEPAGLGDWTVRELVSHLGLGIGLSRFVGVAEPGATPLSFGEYVRAYPPAAEQISGMTHEIAAQFTAEFGDDPVAGFRRTAAEAFAALDRLDGDVLQARRGPIGRDDYLLTRLTELVVHGDDLQRALGRDDAPLLPEAVEAVSRGLADAYAERAGRPPTLAGLDSAGLDLARLDLAGLDLAGLDWVRVAAGRVHSEDPHLPLL